MAKMERASYQLIIKKYQARGKGNVRLTQSSLILIQDISTNTKTYNFPVLQSDNQSPIQSTEIRLNLNDEFVSYELQMLIKANGRTPNSLGVLVDAGSTYLTYAPFELANTMKELDNVWDSKLTIDVNGVKRLENWDMLKHKCTPRTQFQNTSAGLPFATAPSICLKDDGANTMQPMITFTGAKKNEVSLALATNVTAALPFDFVTAGGAINYTANSIVMIFRGMLGQNAAVFQK